MSQEEMKRVKKGCNSWIACQLLSMCCKSISFLEKASKNTPVPGSFGFWSLLSEKGREHGLLTEVRAFVLTNQASLTRGFLVWLHFCCLRPLVVHFLHFHHTILLLNSSEFFPNSTFIKEKQCCWTGKLFIKKKPQRMSAPKNLSTQTKGIKGQDKSALCWG